MSDAAAVFAEGRCTCQAVRFALRSAPLVVHCCHCRYCQRETGSSYVLNAVIEADRVVLLKGAPETVLTPSASGKGQKIARCPVCRVALWSTYTGAGEALRFVRVGTLENPDLLPPDIHIYTESKQPWVVIPEGARSVPQYYRRSEVWRPESLARREKILGKG
ncbi:MAG TPA: GFA family protein [Candidatus Dormibacteraeota bacterium]|nr:GFA family protein [Candidatus Dormibacteraeota bacterium]